MLEKGATVSGINEEKMQFLIEHFAGSPITGKFITSIKCNLWDKQGDITEAFQNKFNKNIESSPSIYDSYVMYCKYSNNNGKLLTVSKKYYYKYIDKVIPNQYIKDGRILLNYWN